MLGDGKQEQVVSAGNQTLARIRSLFPGDRDVGVVLFEVKISAEPIPLAVFNVFAQVLVRRKKSLWRLLLKKMLLVMLLMIVTDGILHL